MHTSTTPGSARSEGKRVRLESPIASLLSSIQHQSVPNIRAYHLQTLLFFIDRHWSIVHDSLRQDVIQALLQCISYDDGTIQSWVLLNFAAIAHAENSETPHSPGTTASDQIRLSRSSTSGVRSAQDVLTWDTIWTNAIRRANVPTVCRAACHTAYTLLINLKPQAGGNTSISLSSKRILSEIEALGKDLDVQGPVYPYDSVCAFLSQCLKIAGQDMRLYRMQLEEKVLSWLVDSWKVVGMARKRMSLHGVKDLMLLLESICGLAKHSNLLSRVPLPNCHIAEVLVEEAKTKVIRDFLLDAQLPVFGQSEEQEVNKSGRSPMIPNGRVTTQRIGADVHLAQPRGRERKASTFLLRTLEGLISEWEESTGHFTAEAARRSLDVVVVALSFESALVLNGTQSNRRLIQCACRLAEIVMNVLRDPRWTTAEKTLILLGLDPLLFTGKDRDTGEAWKAMLPPDIGTGIKTRNLKLLNPSETNKDQIGESRTHFLRIIWQHSDVRGPVSRRSMLTQNIF
jgi:ataxia telangiectasia mutated family protein